MLAVEKLALIARSKFLANGGLCYVGWRDGDAPSGRAKIYAAQLLTVQKAYDREEWGGGRANEKKLRDVARWSERQRPERNLNGRRSRCTVAGGAPVPLLAAES